MLPPGGFRSTPFRPRLPFLAGLPPGARSPWAPPAATGGACLDPTSLADFCQPSRMPGHTWRAPAPHAKRRFRRLAVPDPERPGTVSGPVVPASRRTPAEPAEVARVSVRAAAAEANSDFLERLGVAGTATPGLESPEGADRPRPPLGPAARTVMTLEGAGGAFHCQGVGRDCRPDPPATRPHRTVRTARTRPFREPESPTLTGG